MNRSVNAGAKSNDVAASFGGGGLGGILAAREEADIIVNNRINGTNTNLTVKVNDTVGSLVQALRAQTGGKINIDFAGQNLAFADQSRTLAEMGISEGTTLDVTAENALVGGR